MKIYYTLFFIAIIFISCNKSIAKDNRNISLGDTITTPSSLKYIFLKEGSGNSIMIDSKVEIYTDLYLNESDSIFWSTAEDKDSIFSFIHGKTSLIKGFKELHNYLVEGDEVIAIIPDSLAYGKEGGYGMPAAATLVYNPLIVKYVSEPKKLINDTLQNIATLVNADAAIGFYNKVVSSELKNKYHTDKDLIYVLLDSLNDNKLYSKSQDLSIYFKENAADGYERNNFAYYQTLALEKQDKLNEAISIAEEQINLAFNDESVERWKAQKKELTEKLNQNAPLPNKNK